MRLDSQRRLLDFEGLLARETTLGAMTYPPGTRVLAANPRLPGAQAGDLLFSLSRGARRAAMGVKMSTPATRCCKRRTARYAAC